ncbi:putative 4Fe-4S ferredoxin, iron-sulfur binding, leucine-rich repeat domain superfamily [Helianthus debilis subsp. tardiflorus]
MKMEISHETTHKQHQMNQDSSNIGQPHESLYLVLPYLPLFELLAMAQTCKSFNDALSNDILPWLNIVVDDKVRRSRVTDEILVKITSKAMGRLRSLVLVNCGMITDDGLLNVVANNPGINKLHLPQCTGITAEGIIRAVTTLNQHNTTVKTLKINGISNVTKEHLQTLHFLLNSDDSSSIDVEICPKCDEPRMVYDCPSETCDRKRTTGSCRGCKFCVLRCEECRICIGFDDEEIEVACEDMLCEGCWISLPKCNFCNKPYCNKHAYKQCAVPGSSGFVCEACYMKIMEN